VFFGVHKLSLTGVTVGCNRKMLGNWRILPLGAKVGETVGFLVLVKGGTVFSCGRNILEIGVG
jgi:hypothetical protein